jgi:hypothetical protein
VALVFSRTGLGQELIGCPVLPKGSAILRHKVGQVADPRSARKLLGAASFTILVKGAGVEFDFDNRLLFHQSALTPSHLNLFLIFSVRYYRLQCPLLFLTINMVDSSHAHHD